MNPLRNKQVPKYLIVLFLVTGSLVTCSKKTDPQSTNISATVSDFVGSGNEGNHDGAGKNSSFNWPRGITVDKNDNLYVADEGNCTIRKITPDGIVSTYAGNGNRGFANGTALNSSFEFPEVIAADANGNIYVADHANLVIRKISIDGTVSVLAGGGFLGSTNGPSKTATFQGIGGIAIDKQGNLFVTDINKVYKITQAGVVSMIAEGGLLTWLTGIAIDMDGNLFVSNSGSGSHVILKINQQGVVSVFAGMGNPGAADGKGTAASFSIYLGAIVMDREANMYVIDDKRIRMISPTGVVTTIAGGGTGGKTNGDGRLASFYGPYGITIDSSGNLYVTESYGYLVRKIVLTRKN